MKLHFDNIASFVAVVEAGSFSSAARKLGKSQSTVSTAIQNLESDLGFTLFIRQNAKVTLTDKGNRLFHLSTPVLGKYRDLIIAVNKLSQSEQIVFRVGIDPLVYNSSVKQTLFQFSEAFPEIDLEVVTKPSFVLSNYINQGKIDLALGNPYHKTDNDFNTDELFSINCRWFGHASLMENQSHSSRILLMDGFDELLHLSDLATHQIWRLDDLSTIVELCRAKKGIAFLPEHTVEEYLDSKELAVLTDNLTFFGKKVTASLFWSSHSDFGLYNQWIRSQLKTVIDQQSTFVAALAN